MISPEFTNIIIAACTAIATILSICKILGKKFDKIDARFDKIDARLDEMSKDIRQLDNRVSRIDGFLERDMMERLNLRATGTESTEKK